MNGSLFGWEGRIAKFSVDRPAIHATISHCTIWKAFSRVIPAAQLSVLILDENRVRAAIIEAGLREAGHETVTVLSDMQGLMRQIVELSPDVIVIDLENPNRDRLTREKAFQMVQCDMVAWIAGRSTENFAIRPSQPSREPFI